MPGEQILIIEDDEASQYIYQAALQHFGFRVRQARTAREGLRMAREERPDLIVLDLGLPEVDGLELARQLKGDPGTRSIPVMAVTVHAFEQDRENAREAGCDAFFPKPMEPSELVREVGRVLTARASGPGPA